MKCRLELDQDQSQMWWLETRLGSFNSVSLHERATVVDGGSGYQLLTWPCDSQHRESCDHTGLDRRPFVNAIFAQKLCNGFHSFFILLPFFLRGWELSLFRFENPNIVMEGGYMWLCLWVFEWERHRGGPTRKSTAPSIINALCQQHQRAIPDSEVRRTSRIRR